MYSRMTADDWANKELPAVAPFSVRQNWNGRTYRELFSRTGPTTTTATTAIYLNTAFE